MISQARCRRNRAARRAAASAWQTADGTLQGPSAWFKQLQGNGYSDAPSTLNTPPRISRFPIPDRNLKFSPAQAAVRYRSQRILTRSDLNAFQEHALSAFLRESQT